MPVPYTFGTRTSAIPLSELDANFNTPVTIGNTTVGLGNTVTSVGNLTLTNVTITSGTINASVVDSGYVANSVVYANSTGVLTDGSANLTFNGTTLTATGLSDSGNLTFTGTGNRITGDFSNATVASRVLFQSSTTNGATTVGLIPNGTGTSCAWNAYNGTDTTNAGVGAFIINTNELRIQSNAVGTGSFVPITMYTGGSERLRIDTSGNVGIGTTSPTAPLTVVAPSNGLALQINGRSSDNLSGLYFYANNGTTSHCQITASASEYRVASQSTAVQTFYTNGSERMRIDSAGALLIGTTSSTVYYNSTQTYTASAVLKTNVSNEVCDLVLINGNNDFGTTIDFARTNSASNDVRFAVMGGAPTNNTAGSEAGYLYFSTKGSSDSNIVERMRITSGGDFLVGKTSSSSSTSGFEINALTGTSAYLVFTNTRTDGLGDLAILNRQGSDGKLLAFFQANTQEGDISVSGTTVSYNGGHLSRYAQTINAKDESLLKGTILSNLDEMNEYVNAEGNQVDNEQLNKVKVSNVEGDVNVAGVFVNWSYDEAHNVDEINMAMTGDMIIRIAKGVVVQKGDLLMSAGDGTAKPQGDDIVRSKTVAKVTSNHVTCTYADGSYCVPCVLMAC